MKILDIFNLPLAAADLHASYSMDHVTQPTAAKADFVLPISLIVWISHMIVFHTGCALAAYWDKYKCLRKYKMHNADRLSYGQVISRVLFNQVCIMLPCMYLLERSGKAFYYVKPQGIGAFIFNSAWMSLGHDVLFYIGHRYLLHSKWGYRLLGHDLHHGTKASVAASSMYMSSIDFFLEIVIPYLLPLCVISPIADPFFLIWAPSIGALGGLYEHSGFNFWPKITALSTVAHSMHHNRYNCSFSDGVGSTNIMDNLFKTTYAHFGYQSIPVPAKVVEKKREDSPMNGR